MTISVLKSEGMTDSHYPNLNPNNSTAARGSVSLTEMQDAALSQSAG
jgi:hypothetical protein